MHVYHNKPSSCLERVNTLPNFDISTAVICTTVGLTLIDSHTRHFYK